MIIALDGPAGTGKSTIAKNVAKTLGFFYFDTGAMYRSLAWKIRQMGVDPNNEEALKNLLEEFRFDIRTCKNTQEKSYLVNGVDVSREIRTQEISKLSSQIAVIPMVRHSLVKIQRKFGNKTNAVFEGRDMGTVVFPNAEVKIFLTATPEVRAERRYRDLISKFPDLAETLQKEQLLREIEQRDLQDSTRSISPLRQAEDAVLIDTSDLSIEQVVEQVIQLVKKRTSKKNMKLSFRVVRGLAWMFLKIFYRLRIYGISNLRPGAGVLAANHASFLDPPVISASCPEEVHFLARESLFRIFLLGRVIRVLNSHPISRKTSDAQTFRQLIQLLQEEKKVILFPEGKRTPDGSLQPLEKGLSFLVYKAECDIYPVYVQGTFGAWNRSMRFPRFWGQKIICVFGSPITWQEFVGLEKRKAMEEISHRTEQALQALQDWVRLGALGTPP